MLVENAFFPIILGRSFMEKRCAFILFLIAGKRIPDVLFGRGVRTDPLDQTSVVFMDTGQLSSHCLRRTLKLTVIGNPGESIPCDVVVVRDSNNSPIPIS